MASLSATWCSEPASSNAIRHGSGLNHNWELMDCKLGDLSIIFGYQQMAIFHYAQMLSDLNNVGVS